MAVASIVPALKHFTVPGRRNRRWKNIAEAPLNRVGRKGRCQLVVTPLRRELVLSEIQKLSAP